MTETIYVLKNKEDGRYVIDMREGSFILHDASPLWAIKYSTGERARRDLAKNNYSKLDDYEVVKIVFNMEEC